MLCRTFLTNRARRRSLARDNVHLAGHPELHLSAEFAAPQFVRRERDLHQVSGGVIPIACTESGERKTTVPATVPYRW